MTRLSLSSAFRGILTAFVATCGLLSVAAAAPPAHPVDEHLARENVARGVTLAPAPVVDDLGYLRRVYVDLVGRIPTQGEIDEYLAIPAAQRRATLVDQLLQNERFTDRWTAFYADMLRLRTNAEGGPQFLAFVRNGVRDGMPYDEMCRKLISTNGKVGLTPEVGFVLGDNADPMALAGATSQTFLGIRIACAQCHDHPFDVWKREDFYGFAAYFGKTKRIERRFQNRILSIYTAEDPKTAILWPPEGVGKPEDRKPMTPRFPFELASADADSAHVAKLMAVRAAQKKAAAEAAKVAAVAANSDVDNLLDDAAETVKKTTSGKAADAIADEAKRAAAEVRNSVDSYGASELREELSRLITDPKNQFFSRCLVNRVWNELVGHGIVDPVDDFSAEHPPSHPETLDYMADEFVASGFDLRSLVKLIVTSDAYQRGHASEAEEAVRQEMEAAFLATPQRRMISEVMYDSIVIAGHLFDVKHPAGQNLKTVWQESRIMKQPRAVGGAKVAVNELGGGNSGAMMAKTAEKPVAKVSAYDLESAIEVNFDEVIAGAGNDPVMVEKMAVKSSEELEAERMAAERQRLTADYIDRFVKAIVDDNPKFASSFAMPTPAPEGHFLRVFGQPERTTLGDVRDHNPSMRQALMMLNGRLTHEASRVGELEPIHSLLAGKKPNLDEAVRLAYREILTREPSASEIRDAKDVMAEAGTPLDGMADLRWVLLNSNEFRFLP